MDKNKKAERIAKWIISILIILLIIYFVGAEKTIKTLAKVKPEHLLLAVGFFFVSMGLTTLAVLPFLKTKNSYSVFKIKSISWATGMFFPGRIGEALFPVLLRKLNIPIKKGIAIFFIDRFVSFSIIFLFSLAGAIKYFKINFNIIHVAIFLGSLIIVFAAKNYIKKLEIAKKISSMSSEAENYLKTEKRSILINYFFSLINFLLMFLVMQTIFMMVGQKISFVDVALISSIGLFAGLIPITINGLGLREGILVYLYHLIGIKAEYSVLVSFIFLISAYINTAFFILLYSTEFSFFLKKAEK